MYRENLSIFCGKHSSVFVRQQGTECKFVGGESWKILSPIEQSIKRKIEAVGTPLKEWDINIYRGILTGYNEAFIIDGATKEKLIKEDPKSAEIIRPILRGRDIKRYSYEYTDTYLLFIPWHFPLHTDSTITGSSDKAEMAFKAQYPAVYKHLLGYKSQLENRNKSETGIRYEWYALQRWGANYWDDFFKQKIIFQEMVQEPSFILDEDGKYMCLDTARIITGKDLEILLSVLNSKLFFYAVKLFYGGGGLGETGIRMKHTFFENYPMPSFSKKEQVKVQKLIQKPTESNLKTIDEMLYSFYQLDKTEITVIESQ